MGYNSLGNIFFYGTGMYVAAIVAIALVYDVENIPVPQAAAGTTSPHHNTYRVHTGFSGCRCVLRSMCFHHRYLTFGLRGPYFAIGTLGVAIAAGELVSNWDWSVVARASRYRFTRATSIMESCSSILPSH